MYGCCIGGARGELAVVVLDVVVMFLEVLFVCGSCWFRINLSRTCCSCCVTLVEMVFGVLGGLLCAVICVATLMTRLLRVEVSDGGGSCPGKAFALG